MAERRYVDAIRTGLLEEMERDASVLVLGEDVAQGGPFGATRGLAERFGEGRVRSTPISEATVMGMAVGAATAGLRPVVEIMFVDFMTLAMDQLVNHAAKLRYMTDGLVSAPLVVRSCFGAGGGWGAQHSQSLEAWFAHVPGLKVAMPATASDMQGLLKAAVRDPDPVLVLEHRELYFTHDDVPSGDHLVPLGSAVVRRPGRDLTVVALSRLGSLAVEAATLLARDGIEVEVIDPRTLTPLDLDTIVASVRRTNRLLVVHEAATRGGFGGEIAAVVQEAAFDYLDAPVRRLGAPFAPVPAGASLERAYVPSLETVVAAARSAALN